MHKEQQNRIRIAYLSDSDIPSKRANTVHVIKMCAALSASGANVTLFCNKKEDFNEEKVYSDYNVSTKYRINAIDAFFNGKFQLIEYAVRKALKVKSGIFNFCYGRSLLALFLVRNKFPFIYESHILPNRVLFVRLERLLLKNSNCKGLVVISQSLKDEYLKLFPFLKGDNIKVLHDGADVYDGVFKESDAPLELVDAHKQGPTIGYIGHLYPGKCMEVMMKIAQKMPEQKFHVIGGTDEWVRNWQIKCKEEQISNIKFYGFIDNSKVNACYQYLDIVLLPFSDNIYYNKDKKDDIGKYISPLKLFEAMACGKAIVASKLISIEEVIDNGIDGYLISPQDIEGWVSSIKELQKSLSTRHQLGQNAKNKLENHFSWSKRANMVIELIDKQN